MTFEDKGINYLKMLHFLQDLGADVSSQYHSRLATGQEYALKDMDDVDLVYYQRVLEATIDNRSDIMNRKAMKEELSEVVRERFVRGNVPDKAVEAREFRARLASLQ